MKTTLRALSVLISTFCIVSPAFGNQPLASGTVVLDKSLEAKAKGIRTLFLVIYNPESKMPMPYGAKKVALKSDAKGKFHNFQLDMGSISLMPAAKMGGKLQTMRIKARLDKDGSAGRDQPGDIYGEVSKVAVGAKNVTITLNKMK
ncbi:c-type cytochrome biogenesis protein CcmI/CycH [Pseudobacteriovorax antillogorgiicola]|uniref:Cytochrome c-type biogenesis protein H Ig-like domain-containing protein n=1 Tax=Pseudobacteriovorax antillogorgiicola TaxID=1513793 RepID=A0A1Y6CGY5_9BACT|nr:hypothetical protein [Pseudobacteriovorax antillogorgiicola]TCS46968.1 hypothetical protein EDD56_12263 [Pseudobacteriovorax antillogorgiicola]SMF64648.1 hypothetical protein SAMN06296036_12263 [Pseudobacteriovorax antillogorgiicola]